MITRGPQNELRRRCQVETMAVVEGEEVLHGRGGEGGKVEDIGVEETKQVEKQLANSTNIL